MSVTTEIMRINGGKSGIKNLLSQKNIPIVDGTLISDYPSILASEWPDFTQGITYDGEKIRGSTKKYNQLTKFIQEQFSPTYIKISNGGTRFDLVGSVEGQTFPDPHISFVPSHKYLFHSKSSGLSVKRVFTNNTTYMQAFDLLDDGSFIETASDNAGTCVLLIQGSTGGYLQLNIVDLTEIYGAGNEPTSVAQFLSDYPQFNYYVDYTKGGLFYAYYKGIKLGEYDYIDTSNNKLVIGGSERRIEPSWSFVPYSYGRFYTNFNFGVKNPEYRSEKVNAICNTLFTIRDSVLETGDKSFSIFNNLLGIQLQKSEDPMYYANVQDLVNFLENNPTYIYYELAAPVEIPLT